MTPTATKAEPTVDELREAWRAATAEYQAFQPAVPADYEKTWYDESHRLFMESQRAYLAYQDAAA